MLISARFSGIMEKLTSTFSAILELLIVQLSFLSSPEKIMFLLLLRTWKNTHRIHFELIHLFEWNEWNFICTLPWLCENQDSYLSVKINI